MFILGVTVFWFGVNNAAKEIVREEAIYARERAAGIAILPYIGSKFLVLSAISAASGPDTAGDRSRASAGRLFSTCRRRLPRPA